MYCVYVSDVIQLRHENTDSSIARGPGRPNRSRGAAAEAVEIRCGARAADRVARATAACARRHRRRCRLGRLATARLERADEEVPKIDRLWPQAHSLMPAFLWRS